MTRGPASKTVVITDVSRSPRSPSRPNIQHRTRAGSRSAYVAMSSVSAEPRKASMSRSASRSVTTPSSCGSTPPNAALTARARAACSSPSAESMFGRGMTTGIIDQSGGTRSQAFHRLGFRAKTEGVVSTWWSSRYPMTSQAGRSPSMRTGTTGP